MADEKISGLPDASIPLAGNEFVAIAKGGNSRRVTISNILALIAHATPTTKGKAKLYTALGANTDGGIDQKTVTDILEPLADAIVLGGAYEVDIVDSGTNATREWVSENASSGEYILFAKGDGDWGNSTGVTTEQVLRVLSIAGGKIIDGDTMALVVRLSKDISAGNLVLTLRAGTTGTTSDTQIATATVGAGGNSFTLLINRDSLLFRDGKLKSGGFSSSLETDITVGKYGTFASATLDYTSNWKLTITGKSTDSTAKITLSNFYVKVINEI